MLVPKTIESLRAAGALAFSSIVGLSLAIAAAEVHAQGTFLPTGVEITPTAAPGSTYEALNPHLSDLPNVIAGGAISTVKSPDGNTLLVLASGYNSWSAKTPETNEYIFVSISVPENRSENRRSKFRIRLSASPLIPPVRISTSAAVWMTTSINTHLQGALGLRMEPRFR